ncbi:protein FAM200A-like [Styela clava]
MGAEHCGLLYHSNVRWLSRERVLKRVANLRSEVGAFLKEQKHELLKRFSDNEWIAKLLFLADFFNHLNQLNTSMQGSNKMFLDLSKDIVAFKAKMELWVHRMEHGKIAAFPTLNAFAEDEEFNFHNIRPIFLEHLSSFFPSWIDISLRTTIAEYRTFNWVRCPFEVSALQVHPETDCIAEQLVELQSRQLWRNKFKNVSLTQFWAEVQTREPNLSDLCWQATKTLLPFPTTYLCEAGFSALTMIKTKYRNQLQPEDDIRCALTNIGPDFDKLVVQVQGQGSH